jgi:hypothetical protein
MQASYLKPSHFVTPRTFDDATFYAGGAPVEKPYNPPMQWQDKLVLIASFVAVVAVLVIIRVWG